MISTTRGLEDQDKPKNVYLDPLKHVISHDIREKQKEQTDNFHSVVSLVLLPGPKIFLLVCNWVNSNCPVPQTTYRTHRTERIPGKPGSCPGLRIEYWDEMLFAVNMKK